MKKFLVSMCDESNMPRAWGASVNLTLARGMAREQLIQYIEGKRELGESLRPNDFKERVETFEDTKAIGGK